MQDRDIVAWLDLFKRAWETQDANLFVTLFSAQAEYRDTPASAPIESSQLHAFWTALARRQRDNVIALNTVGHGCDGTCIVHWRAFTTVREKDERREGDGIMLLRFDQSGQCSDLQEWQHWWTAGEPPAPHPALADAAR